MGKAEIKHRIGIRSKPENIFKALTDANEITKWWTQAEGESQVGKNLALDFRGFSQPIMVNALEPSKWVSWRPTDDGVPAWVNTVIEFKLERDDKNNQTLVFFTHAGYAESDAFFCKCSINWAVYLISLKELLETGKGRPFPDNIGCDHDGG